MFKWLRRYSKSKCNEYQKVVYAQPASSDINSQKLLQLVSEANEWSRARTRENAEILGHLFSCFLLIEHKLSLLLADFYPDIESRMFGQKVRIFKDFIKEVEKTCPYDFDEQHYRNMIAPLQQIKSLRDKLAHDITVISPSTVNLKQVHSFVSKFRPDLAASYAHAKNEDLKAVGCVATFAFMLSVELGKLRMYLK